MKNKKKKKKNKRVRSCVEIRSCRLFGKLIKMPALAIAWLACSATLRWVMGPRNICRAFAQRRLDFRSWLHVLYGSKQRFSLAFIERTLIPIQSAISLSKKKIYRTFPPLSYFSPRSFSLPFSLSVSLLNDDKSNHSLFRVYTSASIPRTQVAIETRVR